jgi:tetratricopeptide (TPR) repeat protein
LENAAPIGAVQTADTHSRRIAGEVFVRPSPHNYFVAVLLCVFFAAFFVNFKMDTAAACIFAAGLLFIPVLFWSDRIVVNNETIRRTGLAPVLWARINSHPNECALADIEQIETRSMRAFRRGGTVFYRYRTTLRAGAAHFSFSSGGEGYRRMVQKIFTSVAEDALDNRSIELRDFLTDPKDTLMKAEFARLPQTDVLEASSNWAGKSPDSVGRLKFRREPPEGLLEKANHLRTLANELRISGSLLRALEAFRRALVLNPADGWLLFDFARCLHSYAALEKNPELVKRANAALRLAAIRGRRDPALLARLGESYFQYGDWARSEHVFRKSAAAAAKSFRSMRGLAEIALREGKIAHVIHHFAAALNAADSGAVRSWATREIAYFSKLNADENYLTREVRRLGLAENILAAKKTALRLALCGIAAVIVGLGTSEFITNTGWAVSSVSLLIWTGLIVSANLISERSSLTS